jgi:hypothetical protein
MVDLTALTTALSHCRQIQIDLRIESETETITLDTFHLAGPATRTAGARQTGHHSHIRAAPHNPKE